MKTTADLMALLGDINAEVAEKRAAEAADRAAEIKERVGVVMQLLPLVTASPKAAAAVRDQMYSAQEVKIAVRDELRKKLLERSDSRSDNFLPHAAAQIAVAVGEIGELSAEKSVEIRKRNEAVYEHRKTAHDGKWKHGCPECTLVFVQESKAEGVLHRYITLTHWAGALMKERYDRNRPKFVPSGQVGPIGAALDKLRGEGESGSGEKLGKKQVRLPVVLVVEDDEEKDAKPKGSRGSKSRGGGKNLTLESQRKAEAV